MRFAAEVQRKFAGTVRGTAEEQLRTPFENLVNDLAQRLGLSAMVTGEIPLPRQLGRPDFALLVGNSLVGYMELKAPGTPVQANQMRGRDREQFKRFAELPNILYTNGDEWILYREGAVVAGPFRLNRSVVRDGANAIGPSDDETLEQLLRLFASWAPISPSTAPQLASILAPLCRLLRGEVLEALEASQSPLHALAANWRQLLFPDASDHQFADSYAQTITFALLLARAEGANTANLSDAVQGLQAHHSLLARAVEVLTDQQVRREIETSLATIQAVVAAVQPRLLRAGASDPWLYFYEDFLQAYDPDLRRQAGVYFTPPPLVSAQANLVEDILITRLNQTRGFASDSVKTLDPSLGTGTYLLQIIELAAARVQAREGPGAVPSAMENLINGLIGFELMVGPYSVAELRISRALLAHGAALPGSGPRIYLTDTLESPNSQPAALPLFLRPISRQHEAALRVKETESIVVCIGNPPYEYHRTTDDQPQGGWIRFGDTGNTADGILQSFVQPAIDSGFGVHVKHLYDSYVFFWRWAMWKVFEHRTSPRAGIVSFVTASSYLRGKAFVGMREHMRHRADEIWIIDLGGGSRGARKSQNVFAIRSPVAIGIVVRYDGHRGNIPARVWYAKIDGTASQKLERLAAIRALADLQWTPAPTGWQDKFVPTGSSDFFDWPLLTDLFPWTTSGAQYKRTWPIGSTQDVVKARWRAMLSHPDRALAFKETRDRDIRRGFPDIDPAGARMVPIERLPVRESCPPVVRYGYRSFDRQWVIFDNRVADYIRAPLWRTQSDSQVYLTSLLSKELGEGLGATVSAYVPDMDHFCNRGARDIVPLWKDAAASIPNVADGLLESLEAVFGIRVSAADLFAYCYAVLGTQWYCDTFVAELAEAQIRIPIPRERLLFEQLRDLGSHLIWLHTYASRFPSRSRPLGSVPQGAARCVRPVSSRPDEYPEEFNYDPATSLLHVGDGVFGPISSSAWNVSVSGFAVVTSWLGYRMKVRRGKKTSPIDHIQQTSWTPTMTTELLELLWVLEATLTISPQIDELLARVLDGDLFTAADFPVPTTANRKAHLPDDESQASFDVAGA